MSDESPVAVLYDETGTLAVKVTEAGTPPAPEDPALVVAISPNSTLETADASVGPVDDDAPSDATLVAGIDSDGVLRALLALSDGRLVVTTDGESIDVLGPLTDAELRATPVDVLGPLTDAELRAAPVDVLGPLTDAELRAAPINVLGPLTDAELRAAPVDVSLIVAAPLPVVGAYVDGDPDAGVFVMPVAGSDGSNLQLIQTLSDGRVVVTDGGAGFFVKGTVEEGAMPVPARGMLALGTDGIDAHFLRTDLSGVLAVMDAGGSLTVDGPITDAELRAAPIDVLGPLTDTELRASPVPVLLDEPIDIEFPGDRIVFNNDTLVGDGESAIFEAFRGGVVRLVVDFQGIPVDVDSITFYIAEVDPAVGTVLDSLSTDPSFGFGVLTLQKHLRYGSSVKVGWIIATSGTPSLPGVFGRLIDVQATPSEGSGVGDTVPLSSVQLGGLSSGAYGSGNFTKLRAYTVDAAAPGPPDEENVLGVSIRLSEMGGSVEGGTAANPLRTRDLASGPGGGSISDVMQVGGQDDFGIATPLSLNSDSRLRTTVSEPGSAGAGTLNALNAVATLSLVSFSLAQARGASFEITAGGNLVGTLVPEVSYNGGSVWHATRFIALGTGAIVSSLTGTFSAAAAYSIVTAHGVTNVRVRVSAYTSGSTSSSIRFGDGFVIPTSVTGPLSDTELRATPVGVSDAGGSLTVDDGGLTLSIDDGGGTVTVDDGGSSLTVDSPQWPAALVGGRLDINLGAWFGSTAPTVGQKAMAASIPMVVASDQTAIPVSDGGLTLSVDDGGGSVSVDDGGSSITVDGPLTDAQLRAAPVAVLGPLTDTQLRATAVPVSDGASSLTVDDGGLNLSVDDGGGTLTVDDGGASLTVDSTQWPAALVGGRLDINLGAWLGSTAPTVGQKTMANSIPMVVASDQSAIPVSDGSSSLTVDDGGLNLSVDDGGGTLTVDDGGSSLTVDSTQWPAALVGGRLDINLGAWLGSTAPTVGQKTMANSIPMAFASDQSALPTTVSPAPTGTLSNVASSATNVTLLAANAARRGATLYNDSTQVCYVKFGTTASNTSYTVRLSSQDYYEVPFGYTGRIDGIWAAANGSMRVTEIT